MAAFEYKLRVRDPAPNQTTVWSPMFADKQTVQAQIETIYYRCGHCGIIFGAPPRVNPDADTVIRCQNCGAYNSL